MAGRGTDIKLGGNKDFVEDNKENDDPGTNIKRKLIILWFEKILQNSPWPVVIIVFLLLIYYGSRSVALTISSLIAFLLIGYFGMW